MKNGINLNPGFIPPFLIFEIIIAEIAAVKTKLTKANTLKSPEVIACEDRDKGNGVVTPVNDPVSILPITEPIIKIILWARE